MTTQEAKAAVAAILSKAGIAYDVTGEPGPLSRKAEYMEE